MDIENLDLGKLFRIIKRYLFLIIGCAVGCAVIAILYTVFLITPKYQSYATLIVNNNNSSSLSDGSTITNDQINSAKQLVDTYSVILKSESVMDKVITSLNLRAREGMTDITATSLTNMVSISQVNSTQVMRIAATTADQTLSTEIVTEIVHIAPELIIQTVKAGSVEVITPPRARDGKVSPSTSKNAILGGLLGLLISTALVVLISLFDRTIKTDEDIARVLNLPVLGVIPEAEE